MNKLLLLIFLIISSIVCWGKNAADLLSQKTWMFSQEQIKTLNNLSQKELGPNLMRAISDVTELDMVGDLLTFKVVDLNRDGVTEIIVRIDVSGRGMVRDVGIISRRDGAYQYATVPSLGTEIELWEIKDQALLVADENITPPFLSSADGWIICPHLYAWRDSKLVDVSSGHREFYLNNFIPYVKEQMEKSSKLLQRLGTTMNDGERTDILALGSLILSVNKVNSMFKDVVVSNQEVATMKGLLDTLSQKVDVKTDTTIKQMLEEIRR